MQKRTTLVNTVLRASAYWWRDQNNFGDLLSSYILKRFCNIELEWAAANEAKISAVGSILEHFPNAWSGIILGTGKLHENSNVLPVLNNSNVLALRGPLSAKGYRGDYVLGDLGLLADHLVSPEKKYNLGLIPHWSDNTLTVRPEFLKYSPLIIDPRNDPLTVVNQIGSCRKIVTSSLHGAIVADSFGIPRRIEMAPNILTKPYEGGDFKFRDYHASLRMPFEVGVTRDAPRWRVEDLQDDLNDVLHDFRKSL